MTAHSEINQRIIRATEEQNRLTSFLNALHDKSPIELLLHFNHRGAERLSAHWATVAKIPTKSFGQSKTGAVAFVGREAFVSLLKMERVETVLRLADPDQIDYPGIDEAINLLSIAVQTLI